jgi:RecB family exonuclease
MIHSTLETSSHSRLQTLAHCDRRYYHSYVEGIEPKDDTSARLHAGKCGHVGLDTLARTGSLDAATEALREAWGDYKPLGDDSYLTCGHLEGILHNYTETYNAEVWKPIPLKLSDLNQAALVEHECEVTPEGVVIMSEASFVVKLSNGMPFIVRPDLIVEDAEGLRVVDHKFTAGWLGQLWSREKHSHQLRLYAEGMSALLGQPVRLGAINAVFMGKQALNDKSKAQKFDRFLFEWTEEQMWESLDWVERKRAAEHELLKGSDPGERWFAQNPGSACSWCPYARLCEASPGRPRELRKIREYRSKAND